MAAKESLVLRDIFGGEKTEKKRATARIPRARKLQGLKRVSRTTSRLSRSRKSIQDLQKLLEEIAKLLATLQKILVRLFGLISVIVGAGFVAIQLYSGNVLSSDAIVSALRIILRK